MNQFCWNKFRSEQGVTVLEVILTLGFLSLVMAGLFRLGSTLIPSLQVIRMKNYIQRKERSLQRVLESEFALVMPPWWLEDYEIIKEENRNIFLWYKGEAENSLIIITGEKNITINHKDRVSLIIKDTGPVQFSLLRTARGTPLLVKAEWNKSPESAMYFPLGSCIIPGADLP